MKKRKMKVSYIFRNEKRRPYICLSGNWLEKWNFKVGDEIEVSFCNDLLLVKKVLRKEEK